MKHARFPWWFILIMNMNVMIGAGVFINPKALTRLAGALGGLSYVAIALLMLPLVLTIAELARIYPIREGGLYTYSREALHPIAGLVSAASYFVAKTCSSAVLADRCVFYLSSIVPSIASDQVRFFTVILLVIVLCALNMGGTTFGGRLQGIFWVAKMVPLMLVIVAAAWLFSPSLFVVACSDHAGFASSLPIAMFALLGFETCCSIGHAIAADGAGSRERYLGRIVLLSFLVVALIYTLFQLALFGGLGHALATSDMPLELYFKQYDGIFAKFGSVVQVFVMLSLLGACYGILYSNLWNAFAIAREGMQRGFLVGRVMATKNSAGMPVWCIALQGLLVIGVLSLRLSIETVQRMAVFGVIICYVLSSIALLNSYRYNASIRLPRVVALLSLASCGIIGYVCLAHFLGKL